MVEKNPITPEGAQKLRDELHRRKTVDRPQITQMIAEARAHGDLSENAEYHAAREDQGMLQARVDALKDKLSRAVIVERSSMNGDTVAFGAKVKVKDLDLEEEEIFQLVGPGEEDYDQNKILTSSPIGQGLLGKKIGEVAEIEAPMGIVRFEVLEICAE